MYILTSGVNDYNQYGEYFEAAFKEKPTMQDLANVFYKQRLEELTEEQKEFLAHVHNGGGRRGYEDHWFILHQTNEHGLINGNETIG